jgi:acetyl-CoA C-acetyltransferase
MAHNRVYVLGVGELPPTKSLKDLDFREMTFEAAVRAYADAGIGPSEVDGLFTAEQDFVEGVSIADEYTPDQVGTRLKFNMLVVGDFLEALFHAYMAVRSGLMDLVAVESHARPSEMENYADVLRSSLDPHCLRPILSDPYAIAGLDARAFLGRTGSTTQDLSLVAEKNLKNAARSGGPYGEALNADDVERTAFVYEPLRQKHVAQFSDYVAVVVLGSERAAKGSERAVEVASIWQAGATSGAHQWMRKWGVMEWVKGALERVERDLRGNPMRSCDLVEFTEFFAHQELQFLSALLGSEGEALRMLRAGDLELGSELPVNPSGGALGNGNSLNASGGRAFVSAVRQLRGEAGNVQVKGAKTAIVGSLHTEISDSGTLVYLRTGDAM